jgi:hypothetical protein
MTEAEVGVCLALLAIVVAISAESMDPAMDRAKDTAFGAVANVQYREALIDYLAG